MEKPSESFSTSFAIAADFPFNFLKLDICIILNYKFQ